MGGRGGSTTPSLALGDAQLRVAALEQGILAQLGTHHGLSIFMNFNADLVI